MYLSRNVVNFWSCGVVGKILEHSCNPWIQNLWGKRTIDSIISGMLVRYEFFKVLYVKSWCYLHLNIWILGCFTSLSSLMSIDQVSSVLNILICWGAPSFSTVKELPSFLLFIRLYWIRIYVVHYQKELTRACFRISDIIILKLS